MVRREFRQRSVFEVLLPDAEKLWESPLRRIDEVLSDEELVERVAEALGRRWPKSNVLGRPGTPAEVVLRMLVLKHLYEWSFEECEREVRGSLVYRAFCRIDCERVPDAKSLIRLSHVLGPEVFRAILDRLVTIARKRRMIRGLRMRVDTTVVETNVHYPTDSTLLADGVRVITRTVKKISERIEQKTVAIRDRSRSLARRVFQIGLQSRQVTERAKEQIRELYREVTRITRAVVRDAERVLDHVAVKTPRGLTPVERSRVEGLAQKIRQTIALTRRVLAQTKARVFRGDTHHPDKVLSIFEPHTEAIRKGKAAKPTEFGKMVKIQEAEAQFITDYHVSPKRVPDQDLWVPSLTQHQRLFGKPPRLAVADSAFASAANESAAKDLGVQKVALPRRGRLSQARHTHQKQRWFRNALRWRTGSEGRISALKRRHGLSRCRYRGPLGMERWVGLGVIANNLWALGQT